MKPEIYNNTELTGIEMILVWTLDKFPDLSRTEIPEHYKKPTWIYLKSGQKSGCLSFLKYSCQHDTESSWNPADLYGPGIIGDLGLDSKSYQDLEACLFPEITESESDTNLRFFGQVTVSGAEIALVRLPENTWKVDVYPGSGFTENYPGGLLVPGDFDGVTTRPCISITYGPGPELINNPESMYYVSPIDSEGTDSRTESVTQLEYKRLLDELRAPKILAINIHSTGIGKINTLNLPVGAWKLEDTPERHKSEYYLGKVRLTDESEPSLIREHSGTLLDTLTGVVLGTNSLGETPVRNLISREATSGNPWSRIIRYSEGQKVTYGGVTYQSVIPDNINENPVTSGFWKVTDIYESAFPEISGNYKVVSLTVDGGGKLFFPDPDATGNYPELTKKVATTEKYIRLRIRPDSGYVLRGLQTYSFDLDSRIDNLVADHDGSYVLRIGPEGYGGYNFCVEFDKIGLNMVTDFYVPGPNYYTFLGSGVYQDHSKTYHSVAPGEEDCLPMCENLPISYTLDSSPIRESVVSDTGITIPETTNTIGRVIEATYHGILEYYTVSSVEYVQYRGPEEQSRKSLEWSEDGDSLVVKAIPEEVVSHIVLKLIPKPILLRVEPESGFDASVTGGYINIGETFDFQVFSESMPALEFVGFKGLHKINKTMTTGLWDIHVSDVTGTGTIIIKKDENR